MKLCASTPPVSLAGVVDLATFDPPAEKSQRIFVSTSFLGIDFPILEAFLCSRYWLKVNVSFFADLLVMTHENQEIFVCAGGFAMGKHSNIFQKHFGSNAQKRNNSDSV